MLIDPSGSKIQQTVAPSLPSGYNDRFAGIPVGPGRRTLYCGSAPQDTGDRVGRGFGYEMEHEWMAHGRVGARSKSMLVDHNIGVGWPGVGHFRYLLA